MSAGEGEGEREGERVSVTIKVPQQLNKDQMLAILDAYIEGLERGYVLTMREGEGKIMDKEILIEALEIAISNFQYDNEMEKARETIDYVIKLREGK